MNEATTLHVQMPHLGVSVEEGIVTAWLKQVGDSVRADEVLCEISTDKVDTEVTSPADGVLAAILAETGDTVPVGEPLAELRVGAGAAVPEPDPEPEPEADAPAAVAAPRPFDPVAAAEAVVPARVNGGPACSPVARRIAAEHGLDLSAVSGSGMRGRIRKTDVLAAIERRASAPPAPSGALPRGYDDVPHEVVEITRQRAVMAEHMIRSRQTAAHMTTEADVDMSAVERARAELNEDRVASGRRRLTGLPFIAHAACAALSEYPDLNASFDGERLIRFREVNLGVAVDTEQGLIVPVIRRCERLGAPAIGDAIAELAALARSRKLTPDHVRAGTITLSNPGSVGGISAMAIINQPQVAILGTPATVRKPVVVADGEGGEAIAIRPVMRLALTFDHRVIDGAYATRCVVRIRELLESWRAPDYL